MREFFKIALHKLLLVLTIVLFLATIGLFIWCGVGQFYAQIRLDGAYYEWRVVQDVSLFGYFGFLTLILAFVCLAGYASTD